MQTIAESLPGCVAQIARAASTVGGPVFIGISGAQGCGKSTAVQALVAEAANTVALGLDDFYLSAAQRRDLAQNICPLLETRGPPGTHDVPLLLGVLESLAAGSAAQVPVFSKLHDDRSSQTRTLGTGSTPNIVLLEGWMVGAMAPADFIAGPALNALETQQDAAAWRQYQHACLTGPYQQLWDKMHGFVHMEAPDFATVIRWRTQQEASNLGVAERNLPAERVRWVQEFVQYYQRVTLAMLGGHRRPGKVLRLDEKRQVVAACE